MKPIRFAPLALAVFSAAASADMFTANLYDVNNINQDVILPDCLSPVRSLTAGTAPSNKAILGLKPME